MNIIHGYNLDLLSTAFVEAQQSSADIEEIVKSGGDVYVSLHPKNLKKQDVVCSYLVRGNPVSQGDTQYILVRLDHEDNISDSRLVSAEGDDVWVQLSRQIIEWHAQDFGTGPF